MLLFQPGETLKTISVTNPDTNPDLVRVGEEVGEAFNRYSTAEQRFLDLLSNNAP